MEILSGDFVAFSEGGGDEEEELEDSDIIAGELFGEGGLKGMKGKRDKFDGGGWWNGGLCKNEGGKKGIPEGWGGTKGKELLAAQIAAAASADAYPGGSIIGEIDLS